MCHFLKLLFVGIICNCYIKAALSIAWTARPVSSACQCTDVTLNWLYSGGQQASAIVWLKNNKVIFTYDSTTTTVMDDNYINRLAYTTGASVTIYGLSMDDAATYTVTAVFATSTNNLTDSVNLAVISLDDCRLSEASVTYSPTVTSDSFVGTPPSYTAAATASAVLSISCSWYKNGLLVSSSNSLTMSRSGQACGWKALYCYMCSVGSCGLLSELVCKFVDEYNCSLGNPGVVFPSPPPAASVTAMPPTATTPLTNHSTAASPTPNTGASLQNGTQMTSCIDVNQVNAFLAAETMMMAALLVGVLVLSKVIIGSIK